MRSGRGRMDLYKILSSNQEIKAHLLPTKLFNRESFYETLQNRVMIRPSFSADQIVVESQSKAKLNYCLTYRGVSKVFTGKEAVFNYITEFCLVESSNIIQDMNALKIDGESTNVFCTVQRQINNGWKVSALSDQNGNLSERKLHFYQQKIHNYIIEVVNELEKHFPACSTYLIIVGQHRGRWWIQDIEFHFSKSKWSQHQLLTTDKVLRKSILATQLFSVPILFQFINRYGQVILKPCNGQFGIGIVRVNYSGKDQFDVYNERRIVTIKGKVELVQYLEENFLYKQRYLIQQGIDLISNQLNVLDIRVMVQRKDWKSEWKTTAMVAKVAARNYFVTNVVGSLLDPEKALKEASISGHASKKLMKEIDKLCQRVAELLGKPYKHVTRIGLDIGIDREGKVWIFEANLVPDVNIFKKFDMDLYKKIIHFGEENEKF